VEKIKRKHLRTVDYGDRAEVRITSEVGILENK
jgi:hypothetical protein